MDFLPQRRLAPAAWRPEIPDVPACLFEWGGYLILCLERQDFSGLFM